MGVFILPPGPDVPPQLAELLQSWFSALQELQQPTQPVPLWTHPEAATLEATAPAADYPGLVCRVEDIASIVHSADVAGTWTWLRADGSAL